MFLDGSCLCGVYLTTMEEYIRTDFWWIGIREDDTPVVSGQRGEASFSDATHGGAIDLLSSSFDMHFGTWHSRCSLRNSDIVLHIARLDSCRDFVVQPHCHTHGELPTVGVIVGARCEIHPKHVYKNLVFRAQPLATFLLYEASWSSPKTRPGERRAIRAPHCLMCVFLMLVFLCRMQFYILALGSI